MQGLGRGRDHFTDAIDMAGDQMTTEAIGREQCAFQVDRRADSECAERGARERCGDQP